MFAATDATGTRSLFYTSASGMFAFASRPKALFRLPGVGKTLNETKLLDYLVSDHDRDDVTATIYRQVRALAPASALVAGPGTIRTWRYWKPEQLAPLPHGTIDDYIEPFLGVLGNAIDCRLQTAERVASFLSGGLDSSTLVAMQRQRLHKPADAVHTISLVGPDPAQCADTRAIEAMAAGGGIHSLRIPAASGRSHAEAFVSLSPELDDPFALLAGYPMWVAMRHARQEGYRVLIEGMCGDLLFFSPERTRQLVIEQRMLHRIPSLVRAHMRHGLEVPPRELVRRLVGAAAPRPLRRLYRSLRPWTEPRPHAEESGNHFFRFHPHVARVFEDSKRAAAASHPPRRTPLEAHAHVFTGGLMSFAHSLEGGLARLEGLEERSPYSDRRLIEFAVRMPPELKIAAPWYKYFLRRAAQDMLPPEVVWRQDLGSHPGIHFFEGLLAELENKQTMLVDPRTISRTLGTWLQPQAIEHLCQLRKHSPRQVVAYNLVSLALLTRWLDTHF
jgi:asparagine synthase (glutamine-hydrolysing)